MQQLLSKLRDLPCFAHVRRRRIVTGSHATVLDGLRGLAALAVFLQHVTHIRPKPGVLGVYLFFILSGFLMIRTYQNASPDSYLRTTADFFIRRTGRILPMFVVSLPVIGWYYGKDLAWFIDHLLFIRAEYILWTVKQEVLFYALVPLLSLPLVFSRGLRPYFPALLGVLAILAGLFLSREIFSPSEFYFYGDRGRLVPLPFFLAPFLLGAAAGLLVSSENFLRIADTKPFRYGLALLLVLIVAFAVWAYPEYIPIKVVAGYTWHYHLEWSAAITLLLLYVYLYPSSLAGRFCNLTPLRAVGIVSYGFYLLHSVILYLFEDQGVGMVNRGVIALVVTYLLACITYCLVEWPGITFSRKLAKKLFPYGTDR